MQRHIFLILLLLGAAFASSQEAGYQENQSSIALRVFSSIDANTTSEEEFEAFISKNSLILLGEDMDTTERIMLDAFKLDNAWLASTQESRASKDAVQNIESGRHPLVILVGGPYQNSITGHGISSGWFNETSELDGGVVVKTGKLPFGTVVVSVSDRQGYQENAVRMEGAKYSPLNSVMPTEYVPVAATAISLILMMLADVVRAVLESKTADMVKRGRKLGEGSRMFRGVNITEVIAIACAAAVLGASISWQYFGPSPDFLLWVLINSVICLLAGLLHELTHRAFAYFYKIRMEYRFWPAGSALTLASSYLGNSFCVQGFLLDEIPEGVEKWKVGLMKLSGPAVSASCMLIFAFIYFNSPDPLFKMMSASSGLLAFAEILPFGSMDGYDIKEWNRAVWLLSLVLIGGSYLVVTFLI